MAEITQKLGFDASGATRSLSELTRKLDEANAALTRMKGTSGSAALKSTTQSLDKAKKKANEMTISWKTMVRVIQTQIIVRALNAVYQGLKDGVEAARELGLAIEEVRTISGKDTPSSANISKDLIDLSNEIGKSPGDLAEGLYQTLSNQVVEAGEALNFTAEAAKLATVTASETGDAVNALSSVMNSYNLAASEAEHVAGTLFKTVELGRIRLSEIANVIGRVTPLTAALGISWEEAAASLAVMTRAGVRADTAITQLRAVVTKLIKPTNEMRDIFHKWGVQDGKQAIAAFGGLGGVLKKLAKETGGTSEGMADLLRRVRAIAGQMGIMINDGEDLTEAMKEIAEGTTAATEAWEEFAKSDAHKLTASMQEFNNQLTTAGAKLIPSINRGLEWANKQVRDIAVGWDVINGGISEGTRGLNTYVEELKKAEKEGTILAKKLGEEHKAQFEGLTEAMAKHYVEANKQEFTLAAIRDDGIQQAVAVLKDAGKQIIDFYADSIKGLESALKQAQSAVIDSAKEIANIKSKISDRQLAVELGKARTTGQKLAILDKKIAAARSAATRAFGQIDATKESKELALNTNKVVLAYQKQAKSLADQRGHRAAIARYESSIQGTLKVQQRIHEKSIKFNKAAVPILKEEIKNRKENLGLLKELVKEQAKLLAQREGAEGDQEAAIDARLAEIGKKITTILSSSENEIAFLQSLGLDKNFTILSAGLEKALNDARIDWNRHVSDLKAAFAKLTLDIKVRLDPKGTKEAAAKGFGIPAQTSKETVGAFGARVDEETKKLLDAEFETVERINTERQKGAAALATANRSMATSTKMLQVQWDRIQERRRGLNGLAVIGLGYEEAQAKIAKRNTAEMHDKHGLSLAFNTTLKDTIEMLRQGGTLTAKQSQDLKVQNQHLYQNNELSEYQRDVNFQTIKSIEMMAKSHERVNKLRSEGLKPDVLQHANDVLKLNIEKKQATEAEAAAEDQVNQKVEGTKAAKAQTLTTSRQITSETVKTAQKTGEVKVAMDQVGVATGTAAVGVGSISAALDTAIAKAKQLAAALAASSSSATAYHGGPLRYYADGGPTRGQDNVPAMLSKGETVINAKNSKQFYSELNAMNQGSQPVYREQGGSVTNVGDVNVTVKGGETSQQTVREIGHALRREFQRGNIKLR